MLRTSFLLAGLVTLVPACPLLSVQADVQEVCLTYRGVSIPGVPVGGSISQSFNFDELQGAKDLADADAQLTFTHADLRNPASQKSHERGWTGSLAKLVRHLTKIPVEQDRG